MDGRATLAEIREHWTIHDLLDYLIATTAVAMEAERAQAEALRNRGRRWL